MGRIFKSRYFKNSSFLEAGLGDNPSFVWRSIWEARSVVMAGMRWKVGDGKSIQVLGCPWLPDDQNPYVATEILALEGKKVCQLLRMDSNKWDEDVVKDVFEERDSRIILNIPLSEVAQPDGVYWSKEISGIYSVKSAYKMLQFLKG